MQSVTAGFVANIEPNSLARPPDVLVLSRSGGLQSSVFWEEENSEAHEYAVDPAKAARNTRPSSLRWFQEFLERPRPRVPTF